VLISSSSAIEGSGLLFTGISRLLNRLAPFAAALACNLAGAMTQLKLKQMGRFAATDNGGEPHGSFISAQ